MAPPSARHVRRHPYPERLQPLDQRRPHLLVARYCRCPPRLLDPGAAPLVLAPHVHGPVDLLARPPALLVAANIHSRPPHHTLPQPPGPPPPIPTTQATPV